MTKSIIISVLITLVLVSIHGCSKDEIMLKDLLGGIFVRSTEVSYSEFDPSTHGDYFVAPWGNDKNSGVDTANSWATWQKAFDTADAGDTVYFRKGVYYSVGEGNHPKIAPFDSHGNSGEPNNLICYFNYPGERPILDCKSQYPNLTFGGTISSGIELLEAQYIHFKGLTIRNLYQRGNTYLPQGITLGYTANLTFENMVIHDISGRGVYGQGITGYFNESVTPVAIDSDTTRWINCDFYNLCDSTSSDPGNAADGIKFTHNGRTSSSYPHAYWYLEGCRFWNYSDDGSDIGGAGIVVHENCWASSTDKYASIGIEGNGFKSGGVFFQFDQSDTLLTVHWKQFRNCIAVDCATQGFFDLQYVDYFKTNAIYYNNIAYNNSIGFASNAGQKWWNPRRSSIYRNNIAYENSGYEVAIYRPSIYPESNNTWDATYEEDGWPGWVYTDTVTVTDGDFVSLDDSQLWKPRKEDGSLPDITFGRLVGESDLVGAGKYVGRSKNPNIGIDWEWIDLW